MVNHYMDGMIIRAIICIDNVQESLAAKIVSTYNNVYAYKEIQNIMY